MTPLVIVLAAAPFLFWLYRRMSAPRPSPDREKPAAPVDITANKICGVGVAVSPVEALLSTGPGESISEASPEETIAASCRAIDDSSVQAYPIDKENVAEPAFGESRLTEEAAQPQDASGEVLHEAPAEINAPTYRAALTMIDSSTQRPAAAGPAGIEGPNPNGQPFPAEQIAITQSDKPPQHPHPLEIQPTSRPPLDSPTEPIVKAVSSAVVPIADTQNLITRTQSAVISLGRPVFEGASEFGAVDAHTPSSRYKPPSQRQGRQAPLRSPVSTRTARFDALLEIRVRLTLDRFGFCRIGLLPERKPELDDEIVVKVAGVRLDLVAQDDWYSDLQVENIGELLQHGIKLTGLLASRRRVQWQLRGRDLYVLSNHPGASGFVSDARLILGRHHIVLCLSSLLNHVEVILQAAGCRDYTRIEEQHGVPKGWIGFRDVYPTKAIKLADGSDPFYAIKPATDLEIDLVGGVRLHDSVWLAGHPPRIDLLGQVTSAEKVLIDGKEAELDSQNGFTVNGYDLPGTHFVLCEGLSRSRSYSIEEPDGSWAAWPAYSFNAVEICGPLVRSSHPNARGQLFTGPMSNPLLLGAQPGQVFRCSPRSVRHWTGFVPFNVVWALPAQPLMCDKRTARILQFSNDPVIHSPAQPRRALAWCGAILDASRKGLRVEACTPDSSALWIRYKNEAREIWRKRR